jgi:hypothetical protein
MLAGELRNARFVRARGILEWRLHPERLTRETLDFLDGCWSAEASAATAG